MPLTAVKKTTDMLMAHEAAGYFCLQVHNPDVDTLYLESCPNIYSEVNLNAVSENIQRLNIGPNTDILLQTVGRIFSMCSSSVFKNDEWSEGQNLKGIWDLPDEVNGSEINSCFSESSLTIRW